MNAERNNKNFDELISKAIGRETPKFDFDKWKQTHGKEIDIFESQEEPPETNSIAFKPNIQRTIFLSKVGYLAAAFLVISSAVACFVLSGKVADLSGKVADLKGELAQARRDIAIARTADSATINLYLKEHRDVVARHVSLSPATPQPAQMRVSPRDILYYEFLDDEPEYMRPGIIVRGPLSQRQISPPEAPVISNGHTLSLSEARQAAGFDPVSPVLLDPGYALDQIRRIDGRDALQLLYGDGINSISLFEQPLDGQRGLSAKDFREYAVYRNKGQAGGTILAWRDDALSYVLIGNTEMSQLMDMAQSISASK
ncbi:MAG: hypothetical protein ACYTAO_04560 [Planctomycetota bacterium]|jgi:hypothetical protein